MKGNSEFDQIPILSILFLTVIADYPMITGYEILKKLKKFLPTEQEIKSGTLYTQLRRLEKAGYVYSVQELGGRRARKYTLTKEGKAYIISMREKIEKRIEHVLKPLIQYIDKIEQKEKRLKKEKR